MVVDEEIVAEVATEVEEIGTVSVVLCRHRKEREAQSTLLRSRILLLRQLNMVTAKPLTHLKPDHIVFQTHT